MKTIDRDRGLQFVNDVPVWKRYLPQRPRPPGEITATNNIMTPARETVKRNRRLHAINRRPADTWRTKAHPAGDAYTIPSGEFAHRPPTATARGSGRPTPPGAISNSPDDVPRPASTEAIHDASRPSPRASTFPPRTVPRPADAPAVIVRRDIGNGPSRVLRIDRPSTCADRHNADVSKISL